ncbi:class I SAM-dependent methyltransferase [Natronosporangium hydrolyticum]|uniref:Class I SAM-dependent methyltransferase n=1 Tax=Natronosporangium hydrolyticum TaxID=2811111 RepID=A0A895YI36_9ACTN|nr:class I SAM-dependent methyltransferase [Natronosporangium hydrolyticum]QSB13408.1 class I SAM-dependent methyltransferase [Natronosporangium hydrolyticum]
MTEQGIDAVRGYYASFHRRESDRLLTPEGRVEFALTKRLIRPHLPAAGRVLDIGGGPGRYACWLAGQGLTVTLADLSPSLLDLARELIAESGTTGVEEIVEADVRDLRRWPDGTFAITLALGPFYHLPDAQDRHRALAEIVRVTAPDGLVAIALMPRWAFLQRTLSVPDERARLADPAFVAALLSRGEYTNPHNGRFPSGYGVDPGQVAETFASAGLRQILLASTHGFATGLERPLDELRANDPATYDAALDLLTRTATEPSILGTAGHLLYLGRTAT